MKKQALSFFFFVMFNLALSREGALLPYKFTPGIEADLSQNRIHLQTARKENTLFVSEMSIAKPYEFSTDDVSLIPEEWYRLRTDFSDRPATGYVWNLPVHLNASEMQGRQSPLMCYGIRSFHPASGYASFSSIMHGGKKIAENNTFTVSGDSPEMRHVWESVHLKISDGWMQHGIKKVFSFEYIRFSPGKITEEIILLSDGERLLLAGKSHHCVSRQSGLDLQYYLS